MELDLNLDKILTPAQRAYCEKIYRGTLLPDYRPILRDLTPLPEVLVQLISQYAEPEVVTEEHYSASFPEYKEGADLLGNGELGSRSFRGQTHRKATHTYVFGILHGPYWVYTAQRYATWNEATGDRGDFGPFNEFKLESWGCHDRGCVMGLKLIGTNEYQITLPSTMCWGYLSPIPNKPGVWEYTGNKFGYSISMIQREKEFYETFSPLFDKS